jgi:hypothetical protein
MRRRNFLTVVGYAAIAWRSRRAAQLPHMPMIGYFTTGSPESDAAPFLIAVHQGLAKTGYLERKNVAIEYRWAEFQYERLPALATNLACYPVAAIAGIGGIPTALVAKGLPVIYPWRKDVDGGGLMCYGPNLFDANHLIVYIGKIIKGAKAADLPVEQITKVEFVINLKTAKVLGLTLQPLCSSGPMIERYWSDGLGHLAGGEVRDRQPQMYSGHREGDDGNRRGQAQDYWQHHRDCSVGCPLRRSSEEGHRLRR